MLLRCWYLWDSFLRYMLLRCWDPWDFLTTWHAATLLRYLGSFTTLQVATLLRSLGSFTTLQVATLLRSVGSFTTWHVATLLRSLGSFTTSDAHDVYLDLLKINEFCIHFFNPNSVIQTERKSILYCKLQVIVTLLEATNENARAVSLPPGCLWLRNISSHYQSYHPQ